MSLSGDYRPLLSEISREKATKKKKKKCGIKDSSSFKHGI
jgi:hypothetical protein